MANERPIMKSSRRLWRTLAVIFLLSFAVLGWIGREIYLSAPPIPDAVVAADGRLGTSGVYELARSWGSGAWRLRTVVD